MPAEYSMRYLYRKHKKIGSVIRHLVCFSKLTDRRIISTMNRFQSIYLEDGYYLYNFIENNVLQTLKLNRQINKKYLVTDKINGKTVYFYPAERFEELLVEYYK